MRRNPLMPLFGKWWPDNADVWYLSAILAHTRLDLRIAKSFVERHFPSILLCPCPEHGWYYCKDMGDYDAALAHFSEALRYNPELAEVYAMSLIYYGF